MTRFVFNILNGFVNHQRRCWNNNTHAIMSLWSVRYEIRFDNFPHFDIYSCPFLSTPLSCCSQDLADSLFFFRDEQSQLTNLSQYILKKLKRNKIEPKNY